MFCFLSVGKQGKLFKLLFSFAVCVEEVLNLSTRRHELKYFLLFHSHPTHASLLSSVSVFLVPQIPHTHTPRSPISLEVSSTSLSFLFVVKPEPLYFFFSIIAHAQRSCVPSWCFTQNVHPCTLASTTHNMATNYRHSATLSHTWQVVYRQPQWQLHEVILHGQPFGTDTFCFIRRKMSSSVDHLNLCFHSFPSLEATTQRREPQLGLIMKASPSSSNDLSVLWVCEGVSQDPIHTLLLATPDETWP